MFAMTRPKRLQKAQKRVALQIRPDVEEMAENLAEATAQVSWTSAINDAIRLRYRLAAYDTTQIESAVALLDEIKALQNDGYEIWAERSTHESNSERARLILPLSLHHRLG